MLGINAAQRELLSALATARWQMFTHSLRSVRGKLELLSRVLVGFFFAMLAIGGAIGQGITAWYFVTHNHTEWLAFLLWPVLLFWQGFPVMASAFSENPESSYLLRFPLSYHSYFLVRIFYALLDPANFVGGFWLLGITLGVGIAAPYLLLWAALVLLTFGLFNVLLTQMIFVWVEKWLMQRRTREILGVFFFLVMMSFQFIGPFMRRYGRTSKAALTGSFSRVSASQQLFPPGAAAHAIARMGGASSLVAVAFYIFLTAYVVLVFCLLSVRYRAQYRGENLSETEARKKSSVANKTARLGWGLPGLPETIAATFEKEIRYLGRSGPLLFSLAVPLIMAVFFRVQITSHGSGSFLARSPIWAFPAGTAYTLLLLTNLSYNSFGGDTNGGVQFFFAAPVRLRQVLIAKNLAHTFVFVVDVALVWVAVWLLYQRPLLYVTLLTLAAALLVLPFDFSLANILSIYSPKKSNPGRFGQQRAAQVTVLASFGLRAILLGFIALVVWTCRLYGNLWLAGPIFIVLSIASFAVYVALLGYSERLAFDRREVMIAELGRK
jgi:ABC-2 type transport system permease protein